MLGVAGDIKSLFSVCYAVPYPVNAIESLIAAEYVSRISACLLESGKEFMESLEFAVSLAQAKESGVAQDLEIPGRCGNG